MDPRVKTPLADLESQFETSMQLYAAMVDSSAAIEDIDALKKRAEEHQATDYAKKLEALVGSPAGARGGGGFGGGPYSAATFSGLRGQLYRLHHEIQNADVAPTKQQVAACTTRLQDFAKLKAQWATLKSSAPAGL